ncbi:MAG: Fic family protein [Candidatus Woesearchaeota archaeon]
MAYLETVTKGKSKYYYLAQTVRLGKNFKKLRRYLGKGNISGNRLKKLVLQAEPLLKAMVADVKKASSSGGIMALDSSAKKRLDNIKKRYRSIIQKLSPVEYEIVEKENLIRFTFNTNAIEGSTVTLKETAHILEDQITPEGKSLREVHEVENTQAAYGYIKHYNGFVNSKFVKEIHHLLTYNILGKDSGKYRRIQVYMGGSHHKPTLPSEVKREMESLARWIRSHKGLHPVLLAAYTHHLFIAIHPFVDGNGRTGRLLLNFMLMKAGFPPVCIELKEKIRYTDCLERARDGDIGPFFDFMVKKIEEMLARYVDL